MKKLLITSMLSGITLSGMAQSLSPEVIGSAGDYFTAAGGSIAFTVGEPMIETFSSTNNILTQGFHQPWPVITGVSALTGEANVIVYPNPAYQNLTVEWQNMSGGTYHIELYDVLGQKVYGLSRTVGSNGSITLPVEQLSAGVYLLNITGDSMKRTFRISKPQ
jgi:hypothetical protein